MITTRAEISLDALRYNFGQVKKRVGQHVRVMGIVKANAYGHGLLEISGEMARLGVDCLGVGFLQEGVELRKNDIRVPILVLGGVLGSQIREFLNYDLQITVASTEIADHIEQEAARLAGGKAVVHLKVDTGMERIGVHPEHAVEFVQHVCRLPHIEVKGIYSHFATADEADKSFSRVQLHRFESVLEGVRKAGIEIPLVHIANTGAVLDIQNSYYGMVRPGLLLYGVYPSHETTESIPVRPVLSLKSKVVFVKSVTAGTGVSYGRKYVTPKNTKIATVPIGYGDGFSRRLTGRAEVLMSGRRFPVVGAVCMDQLMVDVGPDASVHVGDDVVLVGSSGSETIPAWEVARHMETTPYEVLTGIAARVPRVIVN